MLHFRYVVVGQGDRWTIIQGRRRFSEYASKSQAMYAAIEFAEKDGDAGRDAQVLVRHEDGRFMTEWIFGQDLHSDEADRPLITPIRH
ncbi:MAG: hypothetical protein J2P54_17465 [Bradyrhizobiaceae bacterium]|nr:hypothetical protein [Bradyrhizobiaceae bacterium]